MSVKLKEGTLDGKKIAYSDQTDFLVEVSKRPNPKSGYKIKFLIRGSLTSAVWHYNSINIGNGYKKRLRAPSMNKPILARETSW